MVHEAKRIDDRHGNQRTAQAVDIGSSQQSPYDFNADYFIAMHGRTDEHCRSRPTAVNDMSR